MILIAVHSLILVLKYPVFVKKVYTLLKSIMRYSIIYVTPRDYIMTKTDTKEGHLLGKPPLPSIISFSFFLAMYPLLLSSLGLDNKSQHLPKRFSGKRCSHEYWIPTQVA